MGLLAPLFLLGLVGLAVPIFVHLTERQRSTVVDFPSLMFLRKIPGLLLGASQGPQGIDPEVKMTDDTSPYMRKQSYDDVRRCLRSPMHINVAADAVDDPASSSRGADQTG